MISIKYLGSDLNINGKILSMQYEIRDAFILGEKIIVLIDPNSYLGDPMYSKERRRGVNSFKNLFAISFDGEKLWEAEYPEKVDYFYKIISREPLIVSSFSSFRCEINPKTGSILNQIFLK